MDEDYGLKFNLYSIIRLVTKPVKGEEDDEIKNISDIRNLFCLIFRLGSLSTTKYYF